MRRARVCMRILAGGALLSLAIGPCAAEQSRAVNEGLTATCLVNGITIHTSRIEQKDGRYLLHPKGGGEPLSIAPDQIKSIGAACGSQVPTSAQLPGAAETPAEDHAPEKKASAGGQVAATGEARPEAQDPRRNAQKFGVYGANAMGVKLMPKLIEGFARRRYGSSPIRTREGREDAEFELRGSDGVTAMAVIDLRAHGSSTVAPAFLERRASIGMMSRRAKPSEADRVNRVLKVDLLTPGDGNEHVVALDGLPILVNKANPIEQLSLNQIARIFSGEIRNWKDVRGRDARGAPVSGRNAPIHIHARNNKSGAYDVFRSIVLEQPNGRARTLSSEAARYESNEQLSEAVSRDPSAIGFAPFPYIKQNRPLRVILSCGISVAPTRFSVKSEEYPLARRMYIYTPGAPSQPLADELLQYAMSDEAQKIVNDAGFIDQEMEFQSPTEQLHWIKTVTAATGNGLPANKRAPEGAVRAFFAAIRGMRRSSMVFRFENGESDLDAKALQDSVRLAAYLRSPAGRHKKFLLVGFADAIGDWGANAKLSSQRADRVAARLRSLGVHISSQSVTSFSYLAPVACNNAAGRFQNRRVEVWIGK